MRYSRRKSEKFIVVSFLEGNTGRKSNQSLLRRAGELWRQDKEWGWRDEMEKSVKSQRKTVQGHAGRAGDCLEGAGRQLWGCWIQLRSSSP